MVNMAVDLPQRVEQTRPLKYAVDEITTGGSFAASLEESAAAAGPRVKEKESTGSLAHPVATAKPTDTSANSPATGDADIDPLQDGAELPSTAAGLGKVQAGVGAAGDGGRAMLRKHPTPGLAVRTAIAKKPAATSLSDAGSVEATAEPGRDVAMAAGGCRMIGSSVEAQAGNGLITGASSGANKATRSDSKAECKVKSVVGAIGSKGQAVDAPPPAKMTVVAATDGVPNEMKQRAAGGGGAVVAEVAAFETTLDASIGKTVAAGAVAFVPPGAAISTLRHEVVTSLANGSGGLDLVPLLRSGYETGDGSVRGMLTTTASSLEVGMANGPHGWLKIRAEMSNGAVTASLSARSSAGQDLLHRELPGLTTYLQQERVAVHAVVLGRPSASDATAGESGAGADRGGNSLPTLEGGRQENKGDHAGEPAWRDSEDPESHAGVNSEVELLPLLAGDTGGWLNIRV